MKSEEHEPSASIHDKRHHRALSEYYKYQSKIYDWTRWSFLFGRRALLNELPELSPQPRVLEIGCGTGKNLPRLEYLFPDGRIYGIDLSPDMIRRARRKTSEGTHIELINGAYGDKRFVFKPFDLILLSYSLSMFGEHVEQILEQAHVDLTPGGYIAVVDFHVTPFSWFRRWMKINHVELDGYLPPLLNKFFTPVLLREYTAYLGLWKYFHFLGRRT